MDTGLETSSKQRALTEILERDLEYHRMWVAD